MENNLSSLIQNSIIINILKRLFQSSLYENSSFYKALRKLGDVVLKAFRNSGLRAIFTYRNWDNKAIENSKIISPVLRLSHPINTLIDLANDAIKSSFLVETVLKAINTFIQTPLIATAYIFLPSSFAVLALKVFLEGLAVKTLVSQILFLCAIFFILYSTASLDSILGSSIIYKVVDWIFDTNDKRIPENQTSLSEISVRDKRVLALLGIFIGILYYFLTKTIFIKIFGALCGSVLIYLWPAIGLYLAGFLLPLAPTTYTAGIIGITFLAVVLNDKYRFKDGMPANVLPAILFLITAVIAAIFSIARGDSLKVLPLYLIYFMLFYISQILFRNPKTIKRMLIALAMSVLAISLMGIYQYFFVKVPTAAAWVDVKQFPELETRVYATLENPNVLGEYLGLTIPIFLGLFFAVDKFRQKVVVLGVLGLSFLCLILTFSRGAWLGLAASVVIFSLLKAPVILILIIAAAAVAPAFLPSVVYERIASIGSLEDSSNLYRLTIWTAALRMFKDYWLTGVGLGSTAFALVYRNYMIAGASAVHAHNLYLQISLEMGIIGVFALIWMAFRGFSQALSSIERPWKMSYVLAGIATGLLGHLFHGLFDYVWYSPRIVMAFWMLSGMMSAMTYIKLPDDTAKEEILQ